MRAELGLPSVKGDDEHGGGMTGGFGGSMGGVRGESKSRRPINVKFEIPYFTTSGIQVRYLKIIEPKVGDLHFRWLHSQLICMCLATIPVITMGQIYHSVRGHSCQITRRAMKRIMTHDCMTL